MKRADIGSQKGYFDKLLAQKGTEVNDDWLKVGLKAIRDIKDEGKSELLKGTVDSLAQKEFMCDHKQLDGNILSAILVAANFVQNGEGYDRLTPEQLATLSYHASLHDAPMEFQCEDYEHLQLSKLIDAINKKTTDLDHAATILLYSAEKRVTMDMNSAEEFQEVMSSYIERTPLDEIIDAALDMTYNGMQM